MEQQQISAKKLKAMEKVKRANAELPVSVKQIIDFFGEQN